MTDEPKLDYKKIIMRHGPSNTLLLNIGSKSLQNQTLKSIINMNNVAMRDNLYWQKKLGIPLLSG